jgi:alcohol dehydrogenase class IV
MQFTIARQPELHVGPGLSSKLPALLAARGARRVFLVAGRHFLSAGAEALVADLAAAGLVLAGRGEVAGEPSPELVDALAVALAEGDADAVLAVGGGAVLDAGKALAASPFLPGGVGAYLEDVGRLKPDGRRLLLACAPTTAGTGSEATKNAVLSRPGPGGWKKSLRHEGYVPDLALLDPLLQRDCPRAVTAASGLDAVTQLLESYLSVKANPCTDVLCLEGLRAAGASLERCLRDGGDLEARSAMAWAAYLSGVCLANAGLGAVHGMAGVLGGVSRIPHGLCCGLLVGPTLAALAEKARSGHPRGGWFLERLERAAKAFLGSGDPAREAGAGEVLAARLEALAREGGLGRLGDWGLAASDLPGLAAASDDKNAAIILEPGEKAGILSRLG